MILVSLRFFIVSHVVFSFVGTEMLTGGSVVAGWDPIERSGPKDDLQFTRRRRRRRRNNMFFRRTMLMSLIGWISSTGV